MMPAHLDKDEKTLVRRLGYQGFQRARNKASLWYSQHYPRSRILEVDVGPCVRQACRHALGWHIGVSGPCFKPGCECSVFKFIPSKVDPSVLAVLVAMLQKEIPNAHEGEQASDDQTVRRDSDDP